MSIFFIDKMLIFSIFDSIILNSPDKVSLSEGGGGWRKTFKIFLAKNLVSIGCDVVWLFRMSTIHSFNAIEMKGGNRNEKAISFKDDCGLFGSYGHPGMGRSCCCWPGKAKGRLCLHGWGHLYYRAIGVQLRSDSDRYILYHILQRGRVFGPSMVNGTGTRKVAASPSPAIHTLVRVRRTFWPRSIHCRVWWHYHHMVALPAHRNCAHGTAAGQTFTIDQIRLKGIISKDEKSLTIASEEPEIETVTYL